MSVQQVRVHVCLTALGVPELLIYFQFFFEFSRAEVLPGRVSGASFHTFMLTFRCYRAVSTEKCQRIAWRRRQRPVQADHTFPFFLIFCFFSKNQLKSVSGC